MTERFQGDPKLTLDENGADLTFKGGQPEMDRGLENAALISLHTRRGWCGNILFRKPERQIGSDYEDSLKAPITLTSFQNVRNAALAALQWFIDIGLAKTVNAAVRNPKGKRIETAIFIEPPTQDPLILLTVKNGLNWIAQKLDPAHLRVE